MAFAETPLAAFTDTVTLIPSSALNYWKAAISQAIDGTGGSGGVPYTPATVIEVTGLGMSIDPLSAHVRTGHYIDIDTGGILEVMGGGVMQFDASSQLNGLQTSLMTWKGAITLTDNGQANPAGRMFVGSGAGPGHVVVQGGGEIQVGNGAGGAGHINVTALGDITLSGVGALLAMNTSAALTASASTTATWAGTNNYNGTDHFNGTTDIDNLVACTQSGPFTRSGAGAATFLRVITGPDADSTFDPSVVDVVIVPQLTASRTWSLSAPGTGTHQAVMIFSPSASLNTLFIEDDASGVQITSIDQNTQKSGLLIFHTSAKGWRNNITGI